MSVNYFKIAGIQYRIDTKNPVGKLISNSLINEYSTKVDESTPIDVDITFNPEKFSSYTPSVFSAKGKMNFNESTFYVDYINEFRYSISNLFNDETTEINIGLDKTSISKKIRSIINGKKTLEKTVALSYSLFWYVFQIELLRQKKSFVHCSAFNINGKSTILAGTGGCGKTSTLFRILEDSKTSYLSEDFGIIENNGQVHYNPKEVSIYASDMAFGKSILSEYKTKFSFSENLSWWLKKGLLRMNPMIKVSPNKLLSNTNKNGSLECVLYLIRNNDKSMSLKHVETKEISERILDASLRELKTLNELLFLMKANAPAEYNIPTFKEIEEKTRIIYNEAFSDAKKIILYIPHKSTPKEIETFLINNNLL